MDNLKFAPEGRGRLTDELVSKYGISKDELRLMPYLLLCCMDHTRLDMRRMTAEEIDTAMRWESEGKIVQPFEKCAFASEDFYEKVTKILWETYVYHTTN